MPKAPTDGPIVPKYSAIGGKEIWLTFDDGPNPVHTKKVLSVLAAHNIKAVFFMVGRHCKLYPDTIKRVADGGHRIGNHTYNHKKLTILSRAQIKEEIAANKTRHELCLRAMLLSQAQHIQHRFAESIGQRSFGNIIRRARLERLHGNVLAAPVGH